MKETLIWITILSFKKLSDHIFDRIRNLELKDWSFLRTTCHVMPRVIVRYSLPGKY